MEHEEVGASADSGITAVPPEAASTGRTERLSFARLAIAFIVSAAAVVAVVLVVQHRSEPTTASDRSWSVPYVDVTLTPTYQFQNPDSNPARDIALAFVVGDPDDGCSPSWGGAYSLEEADRTLELSRRVKQLRISGGDIMVSFGGAANTELAVSCTDIGDLTDAYSSVVVRYDVHAIDLDIEGAALGDADANARRGEAIAALQQERVDRGEPLDVWLTLPVAPSGLTAEGIAAVDATLAAGVDLTGVNVMTMDFGSTESPTEDMLAATKDALDATLTQVADVYAKNGITLSGADRWAHIGATPMIGQNDVIGEVFTLDDARGLADFALTKGLGRVSTWSLNRDAPCSASFADVMVLSNTCSSVDQAALEFASIFTALPGSAQALPRTEAVERPDQIIIADDPISSPYPIWRPDGQYPDGYKVVRRGQVYIATWWNQGIDPAAVTANPWDTPWTLMGPVDPNDRPFTPATVADGTHPDWTPAELYQTGDKVLFNGLPYEARWPNKEEAPSVLFPVGPDSAWKPLFSLPGEPEEL
jgi:chitinase